MKRLSTRLLLTCAAIGVAGGFVVLPAVWAGTALLAVAPQFYGLIVGAYLFPGVIAQSLARRGGLALVTATLAGIVASPFIAGGFGYIPLFILVGVLQEVPFAIAGYRYWKGWVFYLTAVVAGLGIAVGVFIAVNAASAPLWVQIVNPLVFVVSLVLFTYLGRVVAAGLTRAGVARGLALPVDRRRRRSVSAPADA